VGGEGQFLAKMNYLNHKQKKNKREGANSTPKNAGGTQKEIDKKKA